MSIIVSCMSGSIPINGSECVLDQAGNVMLFSSEGQAQNFLLNHGISEELLDSYFYHDEED